MSHKSHFIDHANDFHWHTCIVSRNIKFGLWESVVDPYYSVF